MEDSQLLADFYLRGKRQGPGGINETQQAIQLAGLNRNSNLKIADIGCGTGSSTLVLAKELEANITAIDLSPEFLHVLEKQSKKHKLQNKISTLAVSMENLPFEIEELDVIWSEGAIYNIGFQTGVTEWHKYLRKGGVLAVSEITWLTHSRPKEIMDYWNAEYSEMGAASEKIQILEESGYKILGYFPLPVTCWRENYYQPMQEYFTSFLNDHQQSHEAQKLVENEKQEIEFFKKYNDYYSYGFYIAQKN